MYSVKWLTRLNDPVSHFPGGTTSWAPPSEATFLRLAMAALNAAVFEVFPSPFPPKSVKTAPCFRQFIAEYGICSVKSLHSAIFRHSNPSRKQIKKVSIFCKNSKKKKSRMRNEEKEKQEKNEGIEFKLHGTPCVCDK